MDDIKQSKFLLHKHYISYNSFHVLRINQVSQALTVHLYHGAKHTWNADEGVNNLIKYNRCMLPPPLLVSFSI